jgi:hypothetical protein
MSESILIDFDTEMEKERAHTEARLVAMQQDAFNKAINTVVQRECMATIEKTEKRMTKMMENYLGDMITKTNDMLKHVDLKMNQMDFNMTQNTEQIFGYIKALNTKPKQISHCAGHLGG